ncbi:MAG: Na/Pi cotransporter family protein [Clostridia bacterium]|nr:Na/Pi cotransporter family protein [Clostridia bacterium]
MGIVDILLTAFTLLGGLAFFLYGMKIMSSGLETLAGGKLETLLKKMTSNPLKSLALGAGITVAVQSSSAVTVMLVGLVNSGIMDLSATVGVIMGSNVGTTLTAWITSLAGLDTGDGSSWLDMLKPDSFSPVVALIGILLIMAAKSSKKKSIGSILIGFAILMTGMSLMSGAMKPLADEPWFAGMLTLFQNPILGVLVGTVFTGIIQSSAASVAVLQGIATAGGLTFSAAFPIIMGQNIGTTVTAAISSLGVNRNAKRVAVVHASFNIIGTLFFLIVYAILYYTVKPALFAMEVNAAHIAIAHSVFNIATTLLLLPFSKLLVKLAILLVKDKEEKQEEAVCFLDSRLFATPSVAVAECNARAAEMAADVHKAILAAISYMKEPNEKLREEILNYEDRVDKYEDALGNYLVSLSSRALSDYDSRQTSKLLHAIGNFERISDHAANLIDVSDEITSKGLSFSPAAKAELAVLERALSDIMAKTVEAFCEGDLGKATEVEPIEQVIDGLIDEIRARHIARLQKGNCTVEMGFVLADLLNNYERVSDHCSNLGVITIEAEGKEKAGAHAYLNEVKDSNSFNEVFEKYRAEYSL